MLQLNTFSIVARCERTGELGVAVATAVPAVGSMCPYLVPQVGAASTQSWVNPYLAIRALDAMSLGVSAEQALREVLADDAGSAGRQIGLIGIQGPGQAWTGAACTPWCGQFTGSDYAIQGNMLVGESTLLAMREAWLRHPEDTLDERLMCALEAGDLAGGDFRGKQSAALKVVGVESYASVDLRVDEHVEPVIELRRILRVARIQLFPFVQGMPRHDGSASELPVDVSSLLLRSPEKR